MLDNICPYCGKDRGSSSVCHNCNDGKKTSAEPQQWKQIFIIIIFTCFLAFLAFIVVPKYRQIRAHRLFLNCVLNQDKIEIALENYAADHKGNYPENLEELVTLKYLAAIPQCEAMGGQKSNTYSNSYCSSRETGVFTFYCEGENHIEITERDHPMRDNQYHNPCLEKSRREELLKKCKWF